MSKELNIGFTIHAPLPIDSRFKVSTYSGLANIAVPYTGLITYVEDENKDYRYINGSWSVYAPSAAGSGAVWGSITGVLASQSDLQTALGLKLSKSGGTITGDLYVTNVMSAQNFISLGSQATETGVLTSTIVGEPAGSSIITNIVEISQVDYDQAVIDLTLVAGTKYLIY
jgi:hypothetical protein